MKKIRRILTGLFFSVMVFTGCDAVINMDIYNETIGKDQEKIAPGEVTSLEATSYLKAVVLDWVNPTDKDYYGLTITANPAEGNLENPITFMNDDAENIPKSFTVTGLSEDTSYAFSFVTFDRNLNKSEGVTISAIPQGEKLIIPADVTELKTTTYEKAVVLEWVNPEEDNFYGITIEASPAEGSLEKPVTFMNKDKENIPAAFTVKDLSEDTTYTFVVTTFDTDMNFSTGVSISAKPEGEKLVVPEDISNLTATVLVEAVTLKWKNPTYEDFFGVTISVDPPAGLLETPITFMNTESSEIPEKYTVTDLPANVSYTFTVVAFDNKMNMSKGKIVTAKPEGSNSAANENFYGTDNVVGYKKDKIALDFGYCKKETQKTVELVASKKMDLTGTAFTNNGKTGSGSFSLVSVEPKGEVKAGEKMTFKIKYNPSSTPCWDEMDLLLGGDSSCKLTVIGSSFKQPNSSYFKKTEKDSSGNDVEYGVKLWLRSDLITSYDLESDTRVKRLPDYSGRGLDAKCTDTTKHYDMAAEYIASDSKFNGLPSINFSATTDRMKAQYMSLGTTENPIINSAKGSTTFIIMLPDSYAGDNQSYISCNYGSAYPTLWSTYRQYNSSSKEWGLAVKAGGLYGTYRFPCETNSTTDETNKWYSNDYNNATSICMLFDRTISPSEGVKQNEYTDYPSNIRMHIAGKERLLSYIYSTSTTKNSGSYNNYYNNQYSCIRADGRPVSDAKGHRYGTFENWYTPSTAATLTAGVNWKAAIAKTEYGREYDWAYSTTPQNYRKEDGTWTNRDNCLQSTARYETGNSAGAYFYNWISTEDRKNGVIYNVILGADNIYTTYTKAKIAEVIMFDYPLSDAELKEMNKYIYYRYNIGSLQ